MRIALWLVVLRVAALVALGVSGALLVDYVSFNPMFCSADSGCSAVRASGFGYLFGGTLPVPALGIAGFAGLFVVSLSRGLRPWLLPMASLGAAAAATFLVLLTFVINEFCKLCVIVDASAFVCVLAAYLQYKSDPDGLDRDPLAGWAWAALAAVVTATPMLWPFLRPAAPIPAAVQQLYQPGKINVVEFADFECPFCRALHPELKKLIKEYEGRVHFVRLNMPLPRHPSAMGAAKAAVCGAAQGKGDEIADRLFEAEDLSAAAVRRIAVGLQLDPKRFDACLSDEKTLQQIEGEGKILRDAGFQGLPTTYVGSRQIVGMVGEEIFREAFEAAARGDGGIGVPAGVFASIVLVVIGGVLYLGRGEPAPVEVPAPKPGAARARRDDDDPDDDDDPGGDDTDDDDTGGDDTDSDDPGSDDTDSDDDGPATSGSSEGDPSKD